MSAGHSGAHGVKERTSGLASPPNQLYYTLISSSCNTKIFNVKSIVYYARCFFHTPNTACPADHKKGTAIPGLAG